MAAACVLRPGLCRARLGLAAPWSHCSRFFLRPFQVSAAKKVKAAGDESGPALSPEQQERIRRNKEAAKQRLAERSVPPGFGESWRRQLAGEFSKPYFTEVSREGWRWAEHSTCPFLQGRNSPFLQVICWKAALQRRTWECR